MLTDREAVLARVAKMNAAKAAKKAQREAAAAALAAVPQPTAPAEAPVPPLEAPVAPATVQSMPDSDHSDSEDERVQQRHVVKTDTMPGDSRYFKKYTKLMKRHSELLHVVSNALTASLGAAKSAQPTVEPVQAPVATVSDPPVAKAPVAAVAKAAVRQQVNDVLLKNTMQRVFG